MRREQTVGNRRKPVTRFTQTCRFETTLLSCGPLKHGALSRPVFQDPLKRFNIWKKKNYWPWNIKKEKFEIEINVLLNSQLQINSPFINYFKVGGGYIFTCLIWLTCGGASVSAEVGTGLTEALHKCQPSPILTSAPHLSLPQPFSSQTVGLPSLSVPQLLLLRQPAMSTDSGRATPVAVSLQSASTFACLNPTQLPGLSSRLHLGVFLNSHDGGPACVSQSTCMYGCHGQAPEGLVIPFLQMVN